MKELLQTNGIAVDCLAGVSNEDLYQFLTTELMDEEVDDVRIEGMRQCFIYEEFHPNYEHDAKNGAEHFLWDLFERFEDDVLNDLSRDEAYDLNGNRISPSEIKKAVRTFYETYSSFLTHTFESVGCLLEGEYAVVTMKGEWSGLAAGSLETASHLGECTIKLKKSPDLGYDVVQVNIPGFDV